MKKETTLDVLRRDYAKGRYFTQIPNAREARRVLKNFRGTCDDSGQELGNTGWVVLGMLPADHPVCPRLTWVCRKELLTK
jgi:hypothetical protein